MIALASGLLALAGLFAERSLAGTRRARLSARLGVRPRPHTVPPRIPRSLGVVIAALLAVTVVGPIWTVVIASGSIAIELLVRRRRRLALERRRDEQLADAVAAIAAALRGGLSLPQALAYAAEEADRPMRDDLGRLVARLHVGTPLVTASSGWAEEIGSEDARLLVSVLDLHRRSGGDLPAVLDNVAATLRDRRSAQREVRALTAQARLSGAILGALPIGFFGFLLLTSRREMLEAIGTPLGRTAVVVGLALELGAFVWIRRLLELR